MFYNEECFWGLRSSTYFVNSFFMSNIINLKNYNNYSTGNRLQFLQQNKPTQLHVYYLHERHLRVCVTCVPAVLFATLIVSTLTYWNNLRCIRNVIETVPLLQVPVHEPSYFGRFIFFVAPDERQQRKSIFDHQKGGWKYERRFSLGSAINRCSGVRLSRQKGGILVFRKKGSDDITAVIYLYFYRVITVKDIRW